MENKMIKVKDLRIAQLRYFDANKNSSIIPNESAYAILVNIGGDYYNVITNESFPVYGRLPYSNTTLDGEDYGTMLYSVFGETADGLCYVLEPYDISNFFDGKEQVTIKEIEDVIIGSSLFFIDRISILNSRKISIINKFRTNKIILKDTKKKESFDAYCCEVNKKMIKK